MHIVNRRSRLLSRPGIPEFRGHLQIWLPPEKSDIIIRIIQEFLLETKLMTAEFLSVGKKVLIFSLKIEKEITYVN